MSFWLDYIPIWLYLSLLEILIVDEMIASLAVRTNGMLTALVINIPKYICLDTGGKKVSWTINILGLFDIYYYEMILKSSWLYLFFKIWPDLLI